MPVDAPGLAVAEEDDGLLAGLCWSAAEVTGGAFACVTIGTSLGLNVRHATDRTAVRLEDAQFTLGEGPEVDAARSGAPVVIEDLRSPPAIGRWVAWAEAAESEGVRSVIAYPLQVGAIALGVLTSYRRSTTVVRPTQLSQLGRIADLVSSRLLDPPAPMHRDLESSDLLHRAVINQAAGVIKVQLGITIDQAMSRLRAYAFATSRPVLEVAEDVVDRRLRFTDNRGEGTT